MALILIGVLIFVVGGLAYTLDVNVIIALLILIGVAILCGIIGYRISKYIDKDPEQSKKRATTIFNLWIPSGVVGAILFIVGFAQVQESARVVATSQEHLLFETIVSPSGLSLIGVFLIILGITFWLVSSPHMPTKPGDSE